MSIASDRLLATVPWEWKCRVNDVCDRFEDAWRDGRSPRVEDFLADPAVPPARRAALLGELLKLERELRQAGGEKPGASEYLARFPSYGVVVRGVFGEDRVGDYDLIAPIGEGGMGVVYHARHRGIGREVALKMIRANYLDDSSAVDRFRLEAQLAARLEHEGIVPVYETGQSGGQHFYAMRFIAGQSLAEVIGRRPIDPIRAANYLEAVARAVDFAHTQGVLHRDLKPRNILIDASDRAFVTDFGLAKVLGQGPGATRTTDNLGTPPYMSPEQVRDPSRAGVASDVYSLGATLYETLTGRPPFVAESPVEVHRMVLDEEPVPPRSREPKCPRDLETICLKCLEKEPAGRYPSALALAEDLARYRLGTPILARPVGPIERCRKWARRHPTAAALVAVSLLAAAALGAVVQARRTNAVLDRSYHQAREAVDALAKFGEKRLADQPALKSEVLDIALKYYDQFLRERGDDPALAEELAATFTRVARLRNALGARAKALEAYQHALTIRRGLARRSPGDRSARADVADTFHEIGILERALGRPSASIASYREALAIREALVQDDADCRAVLEGIGPRELSPSQRGALADLARSHGYIGDWEREEGRPDDARASYETARRLREAVLAADPSDPVAMLQVGRSENNSGILDRESGRPERAIADHRRARTLQEALVAIGPGASRARLEAIGRASGRDPEYDHDDFRADLAATRNYLGVLLTEAGRTDEALAEHEKAGAILDALATEHPGLSRFDPDRAWTRTYLGALRGSRAELDDARALFERLLAENPNLPRLRAGLARNRAETAALAKKSGRIEEAQRLLKLARQAQQALLREQPRNFDYRKDLERTEAL